MLTRANRITGTDLKRTMPRSRSYPSDWGIIRMHKGDAVRIACIVSKKVAKSSPDRHRIKRRLYNILQPVIHTLQPGYYYLFPNKKVLVTPAEVLSAQVRATMERFKI